MIGNWRRIAVVLAVVAVTVTGTAQAMAGALPGQGSDWQNGGASVPDPSANAQTPVHIYLPVLLRNYDRVDPTFGIEVVDWQTSNAATLASQLKQAGATWTRVNALEWRDVEPVKGGGYNWAKYDTLLAEIGRAGISPILTIAFNPEWASRDPGNLPSGPLKADAVASFAAFVRAAVERYSPPPYNIKYYEMYNEPDGSGYVAQWGGVIGTWGNYGSDYAQMLKAVYPAVKAANPQAQVVFGGMAYSHFAPAGPFQQKFLDDVLTAGGGAYFDFLNFHYYTPQSGEWGAYGTDIVGKVNYLKQRLAAHGIPDKPIICTETGEFGPPENATQMEVQAQYVPKVYARGMSAGLRSIMWYSLHEGTQGTGLMHNGAPKVAYFAYQTAVAQLGQERFSRTLTAQEVSPNPAAPVPAFEGYAFRTTAGRENLWVVWVNQGSATIAVHAKTLVVVDKLNQQHTTLTAGPDGIINVPVNTSPLYVKF